MDSDFMQILASTELWFGARKAGGSECAHKYCMTFGAYSGFLCISGVKGVQVEEIWSLDEDSFSSLK